MKWLILMILCCTSVFALDKFSNQEPIDLKFYCVMNGHSCGASSVANITIAFANGSIYKMKEDMTFLEPYFNYTLPINSTKGTFHSIVYACDGTECSTQTYDYIVDKTTESISLYQSPEAANYGLLWLMFAIAFVLVIMSLIWRLNFMGVIGSLGLSITGLTMIYISTLMAWLIVGAGIIGVAYFIFVQKDA